MADVIGTRIDRGVKRGPKQRTTPRLPALKTIPGHYHPAKLAGLDVQAVIGRYLNGEPSDQIAATYGVTRQGLSFHLRKHAEDDWKEAQIVQALERKDLAEDAIRDANDALSLARAREQLRSAQWELERLFSRLYGPKQELTITDKTDLGDRLRRARERVIEGESTVIAAPAQPSKIIELQPDAQHNTGELPE